MTEIKSKINIDSFSNVVSNIGRAGFDKRLAADVFAFKLDQKRAEDLYRIDPIARRIVDRPVRDMFREGFKLFLNQDDITDEVLDYLHQFDTLAKHEYAKQIARLHGGSVLVIGAEDGQSMDQPLNLNNIRSIDFITVLDRYEITAQEIDYDYKSPTFGLPLTYLIATENNFEAVHHTRLVRFDGEKLPKNLFKINNYWHDSVLNKLYIPLLNYNQTNDASASIVQDWNIDYLKLSNISDLLASNEDKDAEVAVNMLRSVQYQKSLLKMALINKEDDIVQVTRSVAGLTDIIEKVENRLVTASDLPHTLVLGEGSEGQTTGRSEKEDYYNFISQLQKSELEPELRKVLTILLASKSSPIKDFNLDDLQIVFNSLQQVDEKQKAEIYNLYATADEKYISNGVLSAQDVSKRFINTEFNTNLIIEEKELELESSQIFEEPNSLTQDDVDTVPPDAAQKAAKRGLELRQKWGRGGTAVGVARARDLSNGASLSRETIARMSAFERHRKNSDPDKKESDGGPTAGYIAWLLWGGDAGVEWASRKLEEIDNKE